MKPSSLLASACVLAMQAHGMIWTINVPATIDPGSHVEVVIKTTNFIQSIEDVAISFGFAPTATFSDESLGTFLGSRFLGPNGSNIVTDITHFVDIPFDTPAGPIVFSGALLSLLGTSHSPNIATFHVNSTITNSTPSAQ